MQAALYVATGRSLPPEIEFERRPLDSFMRTCKVLTDEYKLDQEELISLRMSGDSIPFGEYHFYYDSWWTPEREKLLVDALLAKVDELEAEGH